MHIISEAQIASWNLRVEFRFVFQRGFRSLVQSSALLGPKNRALPEQLKSALRKCLWGQKSRQKLCIHFWTSYGLWILQSTQSYWKVDHHKLWPHTCFITAICSSMIYISSMSNANDRALNRDVVQVPEISELWPVSPQELAEIWLVLTPEFRSSTHCKQNLSQQQSWLAPHY